MDEGKEDEWILASTLLTVGSSTIELTQALLDTGELGQLEAYINPQYIEATELANLHQAIEQALELLAM